MRLKKHIPRPGQRLLRSTAAVFLCFCVYFLRNKHGLPFFSVAAALLCIQPYRENTLETSRDHLIGTAVGALWGLVLLLMEPLLLEDASNPSLLYYGLLSVITGAVIYSTVLIGIQRLAYFSALVVLCIGMDHMGDEDAFLYVWDRSLDTLIGVLIALIVNNVQFPRRKCRDTLFVSGVDDTLVSVGEDLSPYSTIELNRLLKSGAQFTIATNRTPARIRETLPGIQWTLPVIAMDGAVLYDMRENAYLSTRLIDPDAMEKLQAFLQERGIHWFSNIILQDILMICYDELDNKVKQNIYAEYHKSPYRNYLRVPMPISENTAYLLLVEKKERIDALYKELQQQPWWFSFRATFHDEEHFDNYVHMKIYDRNATRVNMIMELQQRLGLSKSVKFGTLEGEADVLVHDPGRDAIVHRLKKLYMPVWTPWQRN